MKFLNNQTPVFGAYPHYHLRKTGDDTRQLFLPLTIPLAGRSV